MTADPKTRELVARALLEDVGAGDVTAEAVVPEEARGRATIAQKEPGVLFGLEVAAEVFRQAGAGELQAAAQEGAWRDDVPAEVARAEGPARALLAAERTALNLLCHLSGVATLAARFVTRGGGQRRPHPRHPEDHAGPPRPREGRGGGRRGHQPPHGPLRRDPDQGEPRRALAAGWGRRCSAHGGPGRTCAVEVECRDLDEVRRGRRGGRRPAAARQHDAGAARGRRGGRAGRMAPAPSSRRRAASRSRTWREIAATGVDFVSVGALTHSAPALDLSMTIQL